MLDVLLSKCVTNESAYYDRTIGVGYIGSKSAVKSYIQSRRYLVPVIMPVMKQRKLPDYNVNGMMQRMPSKY